MSDKEDDGVGDESKTMREDPLPPAIILINGNDEEHEYPSPLRLPSPTFGKAVKTLPCLLVFGARSPSEMWLSITTCSRMGEAKATMIREVTLERLIKEAETEYGYPISSI
ncbi:unnamed protein product [Ilex paraguariensis]|uniref:Uncharacterized protein n=1 Tax=Ilex paraguariensis TaxID=185542 RepID=A0ABC8SGE5_9AQUA